MEHEFKLNPISWEFDYDFLSLFEMPSAELRHLLPQGILPSEIRPGVGIIAVGTTHFLEGNLEGKLDSFNEPNFNILVQPLLSKKLPTPQYSLYTVNITSSNKAFLEHAKNIDKMPVYPSNGLKCTMDKEKLICKFEDDDGPVFSFKGHENHKHLKDSFIELQIFTNNEDGLYLTAVTWQGAISELQNPPDTQCRLFNHPFYKGLNVEKAFQNCYMEAIGLPGQKNELTFFKPVLIRS